MYVCECMDLKLELNCNQYVCTGKIIRMVRLDHALCCRKGGLIIQGHNEIRDTVGDLAALLWDQVPFEPVVKDASEDNDALIADLGIKGVSQSQLMALFDIRVVETDALSSSAEAEKKQKYCAASSNRRAIFTLEGKQYGSMPYCILCFECIAIYCHMAILDWILVKRHFTWEYGFWQ